MELCKEVLEAITLAGDVTQLSGDAYSEVLKQVYSIVDDEKRRFGNSEQTAEAKIAEIGLLTLLLEAAKHDCDTNLISSVMEDCKMESNRAAQFLQKYQENKTKVQSILARIGRSKDHIVDADWRQDLVIKTNNCEKIGQLSYVISLKTLSPQSNSLHNVTFGCTLEQLQDLVYKLKDAAKCIERSASH